MEVIVQVYATFGFTASEEKMETMRMWAPCKPRAVMHVDAAGHWYK